MNEVANGVQKGIARILIAVLAWAFFPAAATANSSRSPYLSAIHQLTFAGKRSGEGYFSADGSKMIFQSERVPGNPFYQIYLMDLETGNTHRLSPGYGKTTCAWIYPEGDKALFASTHEDPNARAKQRKTLHKRAKGETKGYSWDFDKHYEIYEVGLDSGKLTPLTEAPGYDAEGSYSPNGKLIAFTSNRHAYRGDLSQKERRRLQEDPSYFMDLYIMNADGSDPRRLTKAPGYDGGPFFSPNGKRLVWRHFSKDGRTAEIYTMAIDGSDKRQITHLGAMSWAPFYHPSGDYLIFATNKHGFSNFELYMVDVAGKSDPVRVTYSDGFDSLPVFSPSGQQLAWTSARTTDGDPQIFLADWNDAKARRELGLTTEHSHEKATVPTTQGTIATFAKSQVDRTHAAITAEDAQRHVATLASKQMAGRLTGTHGEQLATQYVASVFEGLGLEPAGEKGTWFDPFEFTAGISLGSDNTLKRWGPQGEEPLASYTVDRQWRPLAFSATGRFGPAPIAFAGYGIVAPDSEEGQGYDAYANLDVKGKWVLAFRFLPKDISAEKRQAWSRYASLRRKAMVARDRGARGLIFVSGPNAQVKHELVELAFDATLAGTSIPVISVTNELAQGWLAKTGKDLKGLQDRLDTGAPVEGFTLEGVRLAAQVDIKQEQRTGRNVLARLPATDPRSEQSVAIGAHVDHLGHGKGAHSLATADEEGKIHFGADDNASGVAAMLEIAQYLATAQRSGELQLKRDLLFAAWSGEEIGLLGSSHFAKRLAARSGDPNSLRPAITAYINFDMVGRYDQALTLYGVKSSPLWPRLIEQANVPGGLRIRPQAESYVPTDATNFYMRGVPILSAFTGAHSDYHTPHDTVDKINAIGMERVSRFVASITRDLATRKHPPEYVAIERPKEKGSRSGLRVYLGTIPDYSQGKVQGLKLAGVAEGGPAAQAGLQGGDIIIRLADQKVENIYDYTYAIRGLKVGEPVEIVVRRGGSQKTFEIIPESRH